MDVDDIIAFLSTWQVDQEGLDGPSYRGPVAVPGPRLHTDF